MNPDETADGKRALERLEYRPPDREQKKPHAARFDPPAGPLRIAWLPAGEAPADRTNGVPLDLLAMYGQEAFNRPLFVRGDSFASMVVLFGLADSGRAKLMMRQADVDPPRHFWQKSSGIWAFPTTEGQQWEGTSGLERAMLEHIENNPGIHVADLKFAEGYASRAASEAGTSSSLRRSVLDRARPLGDRWSEFESRDPAAVRALIRWGSRATGGGS